MDIIDEENFEKIDTSIPTEEEKQAAFEQAKALVESKEEVAAILLQLQNPVELQKELAARIKRTLDQRLDEEAQTGFLSDSSRKWVDTYNGILESIQRSTFGDRQTHLHLHKISHSQLSTEMRKHKGAQKVVEGTTHDAENPR